MLILLNKKYFVYTYKHLKYKLCLFYIKFPFKNIYTVFYSECSNCNKKCLAYTLKIKHWIYFWFFKLLNLN